MKIFNRRPSQFDDPIQRVLDHMDLIGPGGDEYDDALKSLQTLTELRAQERSRRMVSPDMAASVLGNLAGILTIVAYEQKHVMTSRAMGVLHKTKQP